MKRGFLRTKIFEVILNYELIFQKYFFQEYWIQKNIFSIFFNVYIIMGAVETLKKSNNLNQYSKIIYLQAAIKCISHTHMATDMHAQ